LGLLHHLVNPNEPKQYIGGLFIHRKELMFDSKCSLKKTCKLTKLKYTILMATTEKLEVFINKLSQKYGSPTYLDVTDYYEPGKPVQKYKLRQLYWYAQDDTFISMTYKDVLEINVLYKNFYSDAQVAHLELTYSSIPKETRHGVSVSRKDLEF